MGEATVGWEILVVGLEPEQAKELQDRVKSATVLVLAEHFKSDQISIQIKDNSPLGA